MECARSVNLATTTEVNVQPMRAFDMTMMKFSYGGCAIACLAVLASFAAAAQDSSDAWVKEMGAPQYVAVFVEDVDESVEWTGPRSDFTRWTTRRRMTGRGGSST